MAQNITLMGASYTDVPAVELPKTGGGTATFYDVDGSETVTQNGTYDVTALAQMIVNVAGGGSSEFEYETGTWQPEEDIARGTVKFENSHDEAPFFVMMADATGSVHYATGSNYMFAFFDYFKLFGEGIPYSQTAFRYATAMFALRASSTSSISTAASHCSYDSTSSSASSSSYPRYWVTETEFHPTTSSTSRYWRAGRTYKWIAVWKTS